MLYNITRGDQSYGPYTLADLQRYVASGHILLTDRAKSDAMAEFMPVSQILNPSGLPHSPTALPVAPVDTAFGGYPAQAGHTSPPYAPAPRYPDPPNLHWGLVLLLDIVSFSLFRVVWNLVVAAWLKRVQPGSQAIIYYAVGYVLVFVSTGFSAPIYRAAIHGVIVHQNPGVGLLGFAGWILCIIARFNVKSSLEQHYNTAEPIGFSMSGALTFIFGGIYIQSQLNRINEIKQAIRYRDFGGR